MAEQRFSQNGWPAYATTEHFVKAEAKCKGGTFKFWAANADVALVFTTFIERYDKEVDDVVGPELDDWSFANRLVRGSAKIVSNHGSATAIDLNALKYLLGTTHMSTAKLSAMRAIRRAITDKSGRPVLRLGADYVGRKDQMHVEIDAKAAKVKEAADRIRASKIQEESTMELKDKIKLGPDAAKQLASATKDGTVSVEYALLWGGARGAQLRSQLITQGKQLAALQASVNTLSTAVQALASQSPEAVRAAFAEGTAELKRELADIDLHVSLGSDDAEA